MDHFGYTQADFIPCEMCGTRAVDIHHIYGRGKGMDVAKNLMSLCRNCHVIAHTTGEKADYQNRHNEYLK